MRYWRAQCRISKINEETVNVVAPGSIMHWFSVPRAEWPKEIRLEVGRYFYAQVNIGAERRQDMTVKPPYEAN